MPPTTRAARRPTFRAELSRPCGLQGLHTRRGRRMAGWNEEMLVGLVVTPWQPLSVRERPRESLPLRLRVAVLVAVAILHVLATLALLSLLHRERAPVEDAIVVDFVDAPAPTA